MNKRAVNISSLVILLSLLCFIAEVCIYYFIPQRAVVIIFAAASSLCLSHFFLESALNYDYNFIHASFMVITSMAFGIIVYIMQPNRWISYDFSLVVLVFVNWLVPFLYCCTRDLLDRGPRFADFYLFFHRMSVFFIILYVLAIFKQYFLTPMSPPYAEPQFGAQNFVPFMATAGYIEQVVRNGESLRPIIVYIAQMACLGAPFGYFARVYLRRAHFMIQILIYALPPLALEMAQYFTGVGRASIDDYMMFLIGSIIGIIIYQIMNGIFLSVTTRDFTADRSRNYGATRFN